MFNFFRRPRVRAVVPYRKGPTDCIVGVSLSDGSESHINCGSKIAADNLCRSLQERSWLPLGKTKHGFDRHSLRGYRRVGGEARAIDLDGRSTLGPHVLRHTPIKNKRLTPGLQSGSQPRPGRDRWFPGFDEAFGACAVARD